MYTSSAEVLEVTSRTARSQDLTARLNIAGLTTAISAVTGLHCTGLTIKAEGGFHRVYFAQCDGGANYVVHVAFDRAEYRGMHKMESEVVFESIATIAWLAQNTNIPVPTILYYTPTSQNEARAPFMIMEKIRDMTLYKRWQTMSFADKHIAVRSLARIIVALAQTRFDRIGSIYPSSNSASGIDIGPMLPPSAPWPVEYRARVPLSLHCPRTRMGHISPAGAGKDVAKRRHSLGWKSLLSGYLSVYDRLTQLVSHLPGLDPRDLPHPFVLVHADLNSRNIMVLADDPSQLTILDWECSRTAPLWALTTPPEFLWESEDPSCPELRQAYRAECELCFPQPALWRSQRDRADLMVALERTCQSGCVEIRPAMMVDFLDQVLAKSGAY
ncbi:kinase-like domain-containing protein [Mucidula mucida]|nr:kinase-like domain-containing protein [Mucidula mucida]